MRIYPTVIVTLAVLALAGLALGLAVAVSLLTGRRSLVLDQVVSRERGVLAWGFAVSLTATLGSLYLSEIVHFTPCTLCWYQRIAMYPLVPIFAVAHLRADTGVWRYALPLSVIGLAVALYHVVIQWQPGLDLGTCAVGVPCTGRYVAVFGFVSIPTLSGAAFFVITVILWVLRAVERPDVETPD